MERGPIARRALSASGTGCSRRARKFFVQEHAFLPQRGLIVVDGIRHVDRAVDEAAAAHQLRALAIGIEGRSAAADPPGLVVHLTVGLPAYGKPHGAEPDPHAPAQFDLSRAGADRLALQEEQDEPSIAAEGQAERLTSARNAALDEQSSGCSPPAPGRFGLGTMGEGCQGETGIGEADPFGVVAENLIGCLDHLALVFSQRLSARFLDAILDDELVNLGHVGTVTAGIDVGNFGLGSRKLFEGYLIL